MPTIQGTIQQIDRKDEFFGINVDGIDYWGKLPLSHKIGDRVEVTYVVQKPFFGKPFNEVQSLKLAAPPVPTTAEPVVAEALPRFVPHVERSEQTPTLEDIVYATEQVANALVPAEASAEQKIAAKMEIFRLLLQTENQKGGA